MARKTKADSSEKALGDGRALAYLRTSSAANVGGDSDERQRLAITAYATRAGLMVVREFYDAAVSGADPLDERAGFRSLLTFAREQGIGTIIVETASRFARSLMVQELGLQALQREGLQLVAADSPEAFASDDDPMVTAVRQMLGVMAQLDRALTVSKLKGARDRASAAKGRRVEGRKALTESSPALAREARRLARKNPRTGKARSLREIASELAALGFTTAAGRPFSASQVQRIVRTPKS